MDDYVSIFVTYRNGSVSRHDLGKDKKWTSPCDSMGPLEDEFRSLTAGKSMEQVVHETNTRVKSIYAGRVKREV